MTSFVSFRLGLYTGWSAPYINLTEQEYVELRQNNDILRLAMLVEEKFDLLTENFRDLEEERLRLSLNHALFKSMKPPTLHKGRQLLNRRIANVLSAAILYRDQVKHDFSTIFGKGSEEFNKLDHLFSNEYDSKPSYRILEAFRNHIQHHSLPLQGVLYASSVNETSNPPKFEYTVKPFISVSSVEDNKDFKSKALADLRKLADNTGRVLLAPLIYDYIESLGIIHLGAQHLLSGKLSIAQSNCTHWIDAAKEVLGDKYKQLVAGIIDNNYNSSLEHFHVNIFYIEQREILKNKNSQISKIARRYASSQ